MLIRLPWDRHLRTTKVDIFRYIRSGVYKGLSPDQASRLLDRSFVVVFRFCRESRGGFLVVAILDVGTI